MYWSLHLSCDTCGHLSCVCAARAVQSSTESPVTALGYSHEVTFKVSKEGTCMRLMLTC